jgi:cation diffusion facilitator CzcD-associated flavoprotein CzcO
MTAEHFDVLIIGAGLSGVGAGVHLSRRCPGKSYAILEARSAMGGTWDLFRYPGVRSDSDMHTLGYAFKPWRAARSIADGPSILEYIHETAEEHGVDRQIRYDHRVTAAAWDSATSAWTVTAELAGEGREATFTCNLLFMCAGYYSYRGGHAPDFPGQGAFQGRIVHPQAWPRDLDYKGQRVVVIGSGATAMTLVPAMAGEAAQVTMLQRSPTYVVSRPDKDVVANRLRQILPERLAYAITRWKNVTLQLITYNKTRTDPRTVKRLILAGVRKELGPDYDVETHFTPKYNPWDQRLCLVPNGDLFRAIRSGKARVVTDRIETFTEGGIRLASGETLEADIIVTATGLNLAVMGEARFSVDGQSVDFGQTWTYKGMMVSGVPNLISTFGYINASWTLRADLTCEFVCRLVNHLDRTGTTQATPRLRPGEADMPARPWIADFSAGYMRREMHRFPRQGDRDPWTNPQTYARDKAMIRRGPLEDGALVFERAASAPARPAAPMLRAAE